MNYMLKGAYDFVVDMWPFLIGIFGALLIGILIIYFKTGSLF